MLHIPIILLFLYLSSNLIDLSPFYVLSKNLYIFYTIQMKKIEQQMSLTHVIDSYQNDSQLCSKWLVVLINTMMINIRKIGE
jgi:hypothetical protein